MRTTYKIRAQIEVIEDEGDRVTNWSVGEWVEIKEFRSRKKAEAFLKQLSTHAEALERIIDLYIEFSRPLGGDVWFDGSSEAQEKAVEGVAAIERELRQQAKRYGATFPTPKETADLRHDIRHDKRSVRP